MIWLVNNKGIINTTSIYKRIKITPSPLAFIVGVKSLYHNASSIDRTLTQIRVVMRNKIIKIQIKILT